MKKTFTLTQLVTSIKSVLNKSYGQNMYWVTAELIKFNVKAGHIYLELADTSDNNTTAQIKATIWKNKVLLIQQTIGNDFSSLLQVGNKLLFQVSVMYHEIYGLTLSINDIDPAFTYGEIELKKKHTIAQLKKEGLFSLQKSIKLPRIIKRIVLVGSPDTSGYKDFLSEIKTNNIFTKFTIKELSTSVQGEKATSEIISALLTADEYDADAIILIRGGGSKMDLNVFNSYEICKTIATLRLPVLTGIGHETDEVVADLVANLSNITPTAVAKFLYVRVGTFRADLQYNIDNILKQALTQFSETREKFNNTNKFLSHYFQNIINENEIELKNNIHFINLHTNQIINDQLAILDIALTKSISFSINTLHMINDIELPTFLNKIDMLTMNIVDVTYLNLKSLKEKVDVLNPLKLLEVGYTISSISNTDISKYQGNLLGEEMQTLTNSFIVFSTITKIN